MFCPECSSGEQKTFHTYSRIVIAHGFGEYYEGDDPSGGFGKPLKFEYDAMYGGKAIGFVWYDLESLDKFRAILINQTLLDEEDDYFIKVITSSPKPPPLIVDTSSLVEEFNSKINSEFKRLRLLK